RARARQFGLNNPYAKKYLRLLQLNVADGMKLHSLVKNANGTFDKSANKLLEDQWKVWGKKETCCVDGLLNWNDALKLIISSVARDGEIFIRLIRNFKNDFGFAIQIIEPDYFDIYYNINDIKTGNYIRMSIEYD